MAGERTRYLFVQIFIKLQQTGLRNCKALQDFLGFALDAKVFVRCTKTSGQFMLHCIYIDQAKRRDTKSKEQNHDAEHGRHAEIG